MHHAGVHIHEARLCETRPQTAACSVQQHSGGSCAAIPCAATQRGCSARPHTRVLCHAATQWNRQVLCAVTQKARKAQPTSASVVWHTQLHSQGAATQSGGRRPDQGVPCNTTQRRQWRAAQHHVGVSCAATQMGHTVSVVCHRTEEGAAQGHTVLSSVQAHGECSATQRVGQHKGHEAQVKPRTVQSHKQEQAKPATTGA